MYVCVPCACPMSVGGRRGQLDPLELKLQGVVSFLVGSGNQSHVFCKSRLCSWSLNHLQPPFHEFLRDVQNRNHSRRHGRNSHVCIVHGQCNYIPHSLSTHLPQPYKHLLLLLWFPSLDTLIFFQSILTGQNLSRCLGHSGHLVDVCWVNAATSFPIWRSVLWDNFQECIVSKTGYHMYRESFLWQHEIPPSALLLTVVFLL